MCVYVSSHPPQSLYHVPTLNINQVFHFIRTTSGSLSLSLSLSVTRQLLLYAVYYGTVSTLKAVFSVIMYINVYFYTPLFFFTMYTCILHTHNDHCIPCVYVSVLYNLIWQKANNSIKISIFRYYFE